MRQYPGALRERYGEPEAAKKENEQEEMPELNRYEKNWRFFSRSPESGGAWRREISMIFPGPQICFWTITAAAVWDG